MLGVEYMDLLEDFILYTALIQGRSAGVGNDLLTATFSNRGHVGPDD